MEKKYRDCYDAWLDEVVEQIECFVLEIVLNTVKKCRNIYYHGHEVPLHRPDEDDMTF